LAMSFIQSMKSWPAVVESRKAWSRSVSIAVPSGISRVVAVQGGRLDVVAAVKTDDAGPRWLLPWLSQRPPSGTDAPDCHLRRRASPEQPAESHTRPARWPSRPQGRRWPGRVRAEGAAHLPAYHDLEAVALMRGISIPSPYVLHRSCIPASCGAG
jgi:hypothetical protein